MGVVIWKRKVSEELNKKYKSKVLPEIKGYDVQLELSDQILDALEEEKDNLTPQQMIEDAQDLFEDAVAELADALKKLDSSCVGKEEDKVREEVKEFEKELDGAIKNLGSEVTRVPRKRWDTFLKHHEQYKKFKWECRWKVAMGTIGAIGAIVSVTVSGGAGLVLAIVGLVRTMEGLAKLTHDRLRKIKSIQDSVLKDLRELEATYKKDSPNWIGVEEVGGAFLNSVLGVALKNTVPALDANVKLWSNRVAEVDVLGHKLAKDALAALRKVDELEKQLTQAEAEFRKLGGAAAVKPFLVLKQLKPSVPKLQHSLDALLNETTSINGQINRDMAKCLKIAQAIVLTLKQRVPAAAQKAAKWIPVFTNLALGAASAGLGVTQMTTVLKEVNTSVGLAQKLAVNGKDIWDKAH